MSFGGELKPCPFCGSEASLHAKYGKHGWFVFAQCETCGAQTRVKNAVDIAEENFWEQGAVDSIVRLWNRRA